MMERLPSMTRSGPNRHGDCRGPKSIGARYDKMCVNLVLRPQGVLRTKERISLSLRRSVAREAAWLFHHKRRTAPLKNILQMDRCSGKMVFSVEINDWIDTKTYIKDK